MVLHAVLDEDSISALHIFTTPTEEARPKDTVSFTVNPKHRYMFAFLSESGTVTIWSVQSDKRLSECAPAKEFKVHDRRDGHSAKPITSKGKFLTLDLNDLEQSGRDDRLSEPCVS